MSMLLRNSTHACVYVYCGASNDVVLDVNCVTQKITTCIFIKYSIPCSPLQIAHVTTETKREHLLSQQRDGLFAHLASDIVACNCPVQRQIPNLSRLQCSAAIMHLQHISTQYCKIYRIVVSVASDSHLICGYHCKPKLYDMFEE